MTQGFNMHSASKQKKTMLTQISSLLPHCGTTRNIPAEIWRFEMDGW